MSKVIDKYISENKVNEALEECLRENQYHLGLLLAKIYQETEKNPRFRQLFSKLIKAVNGIQTDGNEIIVAEDIINETNPSLLETDNIIEYNQINEIHINNKIRVLLYCNWCDSKTLCNIWNKMSKGDYTWNNIQIVWEEPADYYVVINCPPITIFPDTRKTILFQMEPNMSRNEYIWGDWSKPLNDSFLYCCTHDRDFNNNEWHLSKTYNQLLSEPVVKDETVVQILSTVLSDKYKDPGHVKRIGFIKFLESKGMDVHVYGGNKFEWKNYKGSLPYHNKDNAMFPYKYVFNAENHDIKNYYTEKLIDGILAECLTCYWGCPNIKELIDERAYVYLDLIDFESDFKKIQRMISEDWWSQRIDIIRKEKNRILNDLQFFPRIEGIINNVRKL